jgi:signal transduction histidine kinase
MTADPPSGGTGPDAAGAQRGEVGDEPMRVLLAVDAVSRASLESRTSTELLEKLLETFAGAARGADTAAIMIREGDTLTSRAATGAGGDRLGPVAARMGEGFVGRIASEGRPAHLTSAGEVPPDVAGVRALYGVPLLHGDEVVGVACMGSLRVDEFEPEELRLFDAITARAAHGVALHLAREAAEARAAELREATSRLGLLSTVSDALAVECDPGRRVRRAAELPVPAFADWCAVVVVEDGLPRRVEVHAADPQEEALSAALSARFEDELDRDGGVARVVREGTPELLPEVPSGWVERAVAAPAARALLAHLGLRSYLAIPLREDGRIHGAMLLGMIRSGRHFDEGSLQVATELARRVALAVESARLLESARRDARLRNEVLAVVSHDLRTPLSAILMSASRVALSAPSGSAGAALRSLAEVIRRSTGRMDRLIHDLLDVAAIQAGRLSVNVIPHPPSELVREAVEGLQLSAQERRVALDVDVAPGLPRVLADRDRILQVLANLVTNALKVTPDGGRIRVRVAAVDAGFVRFAVSDAGPGVAPAERRRIFEPYRRGAEAAYRGTGLGLAIARGIVEAHRGRIGVESEVGAGSTFWFWLTTAPHGPA